MKRDSEDEVRAWEDGVGLEVIELSRGGELPPVRERRIMSEVRRNLRRKGVIRPGRAFQAFRSAEARESGLGGTGEVKSKSAVHAAAWQFGRAYGGRLDVTP